MSDERKRQRSVVWALKALPQRCKDTDILWTKQKKHKEKNCSLCSHSECCLETNDYDITSCCFAQLQMCNSSIFRPLEKLRLSWLLTQRFWFKWLFVGLIGGINVVHDFVLSGLEFKRLGGKSRMVRRCFCCWTTMMFGKNGELSLLFYLHHREKCTFENLRFYALLELLQVGFFSPKFLSTLLMKPSTSSYLAILPLDNNTSY